MKNLALFDNYQSITPPTFTNTNSLIYRTTPPSHQIINLFAPQKNIELKVIVIQRTQSFKTKKGQINQYLISDQTACCFINFFNDIGRMVEVGDILYLSGVYSSFFKGRLMVYQGSQSIVRKVGKWYLKFKMDQNVSLRASESSKEMK